MKRFFKIKITILLIAEIEMRHIYKFIAALQEE